MGENYLIEYYQEIEKGNIIVGKELKDQRRPLQRKLRILLRQSLAQMGK